VLKLTTSDTGKPEDEEAFDLSEVYSILCGQLWKSTSFIQFCIISETLELMLKIKVRTPTISCAQ
jgi:nucleolar pre-ribosomal-associated protein 2